MKVLKKLPLLAWIVIAIAAGVLIGLFTPGMISGINDATGAAIPTDLVVQLFVSFSTVFSAFLRLSLRVVFRPQPQPLQFSQRLTRLIFR